MQVTSVIFGLLFSASGVIAAPGKPVIVKPVKPTKPTKPTKPQPPTNNIQTISCGSGNAPYCCNNEVDKDGVAAFTCSALSGESATCNSITVCCNNQGNNGGNTAQSCAPFGNSKVIFVDL
ncbi:hypothetical protein FZEAL_3906 [Fusarium zealandicum]|uniref:Hydrophobin n=1 Tax=Fusarium zealandicum TaxID=1053134 RepID=A0A8H4UMY2_9HYPO|nr:hypothetical protein FZEAL_3906 [Fusarium zealandicum]